MLLGAAVPRDSALWRRARAVVAGRLINGWSDADWTLRFLYRFQSFELRVAGIAPVENAGVENVDLTRVVTGHMQYPRKLAEILRMLHLE